MNPENDPENPRRDDTADNEVPDVFGMAGTDADQTEDSYRPEGNTAQQTGVLPAYDYEEYYTEEERQLGMTDEEQREYYEKYGPDGIESHPVAYDYKQRLRSDSGSMGYEDVRKNKVPTWIYTVMLFLGIAVIGVTGYMFVSNYIEGSATQIAPIPEEEALFDANSAATYDGPGRHEIDWEAEFDKIEYQEEGNVAGVVVPSLGMYSETISTGAENGSLVLPDAPQGTWYEQTVPVGADEGNTILAGHVNYSDTLDFSPWALLHESERGMLIGVRDAEGEIFVYETSAMEIYSRQALPEEYFRKDGEHEIHLVTCSGEVVEDPENLGGRYFEHNLVVTGELVEET